MSLIIRITAVLYVLGKLVKHMCIPVQVIFVQCHNDEMKPPFHPTGTAQISNHIYYDLNAM